MIVGLSGIKGSGKDALAGMLTMPDKLDKPSEWARMAFADPLKEEVHCRFSVPMDLLHANQEIKDSTLVDTTFWDLHTQYGMDLACMPPTAHPLEPLTVRQLLQFYGTECVRAKDDNYWINKFKHKLKDYIAYTNVVVTDVRFPNEFKCIESLGGITVEVISKDAPADVHASESHSNKAMFKVKGRGFQTLVESYQDLVSIIKENHE